MTYEELVEVAKRRGIVRWTNSGIVEHLHIADRGKVLARPHKTPTVHHIGKRDGDYLCAEVQRSEVTP